MVEMLVVTLMIVLLAISVGKMFGMMLSIEQKFCRQSDVMESQADNLAYAERYLSLAKSVDATHVASFRMEAGGVSFETSHWTRVSAFSALEDSQALLCQVNSADARRGVVATNRLSACGRQRYAPATITKVWVDGGTNCNMRRVRLVAGGCSGDGTEFSITNDRPVKLWNCY